jgi:carbon monoxide dehydrogenase subunit G
MLTLNETFAAPDADQAWSVVNDLTALVPCVPGARVKSVESAQAVKAEIAVRMGAMGMTFTGPVKIESSDAANRTLTIKANTRETLGQSYATGDITISLRDGEGTVDAIANVGGKAAGMGEGVIVDVLTNLVRSFSANIASALLDLPQRGLGDDGEPAEAVREALLDETPGKDSEPADAVEVVAPPRCPASRSRRASSNRCRGASAAASTSS